MMSSQARTGLHPSFFKTLPFEAKMQALSRYIFNYSKTVSYSGKGCVSFYNREYV